VVRSQRSPMSSATGTRPVADGVDYPSPSGKPMDPSEDLEGPPTIRTAVVFVNYGPYHLARSRALAAHAQIDAYFIELASAENKYPWRAEKDELHDRLITLCKGPYEHSSGSELERKIVAVLRELKPRALVVAGYSERPMRRAAGWARRNGCAVVLLSETTGWDHPRRWWLESMKRLWIGRHIDAVMVGGRPHRAYIAELGVAERRIWDRYDVVDNDFFSGRADRLRAGAADRRREEVGLPNRYFLYVGRFAREKNLPILLKAYARYHHAHPDGWGLVMVGDGPQREELFQIARSQELKDVVFPGFKQFDELPLYYAFAGSFILPSILEPWGLVVNEAMASGLPVLVSQRCGCAADLVYPGQNGFTFNPNDVEEIGRLMDETASLSPERLAEMGRASKKIISQWTPEAWANQLACAVRCAVTVRNQ
jgi:1,2-diacylglycerol 3-alpha-glucosyltransferase